MSDPTQPQDTSAGSEEVSANEETRSPEAAAPEDVRALKDKVALLETQIADLTDRLLRAHADIDNLRKRAERERSETAKYAISKFAADVISAGDSFQHAIGAVHPEAAEKDPALKSFLDGVVLAERAFLGVLDRHGIKQLNPKGDPFNPHLHHAAAEEQDASVPAGTIVKVYQVGYLLEERVLRPAMVVVARGGSKTSPGDGDAGTGETSAEADSKSAGDP